MLRYVLFVFCYTVIMIPVIISYKVCTNLCLARFVDEGNGFLGLLQSTDERKPAWSNIIARSLSLHVCSPSPTCRVTPLSPAPSLFYLSRVVFVCPTYNCTVSHRISRTLRAKI